MPSCALRPTAAQGKPTRLASQFRLSYNMIVNLLRAAGVQVGRVVLVFTARARVQT